MTQKENKPQMSHKANKTPRGGVQYRKTGRFLLTLVATFLFGVSLNLQNTDSAYADNPCSYQDNTVTIDSDNNIKYSGGINQSTASWNNSTATLTLNGYNAGPICFRSGSLATIVLEGTNTINSTTSFGIDSQGSLIVEGSGTLNMTITDNDDSVELRAFSISEAAIFNGGIININTPQISSAESCFALETDEGIVVINGGSISSDCGISVISNKASVVFINGGTVSVGQIATQIFNQTGGTVNIVPRNDYHQLGADDGFGYCLVAAYYVFNGGTTNIDCRQIDEPGAMAIHTESPHSITEDLDNLGVPYALNGDLVEVSLRYYMERMGFDISDVPNEKLETVNILIPSSTTALFNDGDISIKGPLVPIVAILEVSGGDESILQNATLDHFFKLSDSMTTDTPTIAPYNFMSYDEDGVPVGVFVFTDGSDGAYVHYDEGGENIEVSDNVLKTLHIHKATAPIPSADSDEKTAEEKEENPNTLDYHLVSIISTILVSIVAEAFIIIDLKKRAKTLQSQITENSTTDSTNCTPDVDNANPKGYNS